MTTYTNEFKTALAVIAAILTVAVVAGCGNTDTTTVTEVDQQLETKPLDLLLPDCSGSFKGQLAGFTDTFEKVVSDSASRGRRLWMACFEGSLLRTADFDPKVDFGVLPDSVVGNEKLAARFTQARALGTVKKIERAISGTENQVSGSGQLEALEVAARTPDTGRVFMVTDLMSYEVDGLTLATATKADIRRTVKQWLPRLGNGLRGVHVFIVGVGLGAGSSEAVRNAKALFTQVVTKARGKVSITQELPAALVLHGGGS